MVVRFEWGGRGGGKSEAINLVMYFFAANEVFFKIPCIDRESPPKGCGNTLEGTAFPYLESYFADWPCPGLRRPKITLVGALFTNEDWCISHGSVSQRMGDSSWAAFFLDSFSVFQSLTFPDVRRKFGWEWRRLVGKESLLLAVRSYFLAGTDFCYLLALEFEKQKVLIF